MAQELVCKNVNIEMLKDITIKKVSQLSGIRLDKTEDFFTEAFNTVFYSIINTEIYKGDVPINQYLLKTNNIIIKEAVNFIASQLIEPDPESEIEPMASRIIDTPEPAEIEVKPEFKNRIITITNNNVLNENDIFTSKINLTGVKSIELISTQIDFSDYIITNYENAVCVNGVDYSIPAGNYTVEEICKYFTNNIFTLNIDKNTEQFFFTVTNNKGSLTSMAKAKDEALSIDFSIKNSIADILGFKKEIYDKTAKAEKKHGLSHKRMAYIKYHGVEWFNEETCVDFNVPYNSTVFYKPYYKKIYMPKSIEDIQNLTFSIVCEKGFPYNTRYFCIKLGIETLVN